MGIVDKIKDVLDGGEEPTPASTDTAAETPAVEAPAADAGSAPEYHYTPAEQAAVDEQLAAEAEAKAARKAERKSERKEARKEERQAARQEAKAEAKAEAKTEPQQDAARTYTVKAGDTLSEIGAKYGVDYMDIARLNKIENPDLIYPGQVFTIPQH
jgi:nucleoid-associated protein YgaU